MKQINLDKIRIQITKEILERNWKEKQAKFLEDRKNYQNWVISQYGVQTL